MGKVKKLRQKYHISLKKSKSLNNLGQVDTEQKNENIIKDSLFMTGKQNIFEGINISLQDLNKSLPADFDARSVVSTKSRKELKEEEKHMKKKEKIKLRHERFMKKLNVTQQILRDSKKRTKKNKKSLCGDMSSLLDALPSLQSLEKDRGSRKYEKPKGKLKGIQKAKDRLKQQSLDSKIFKQILDDKTFKENPFQAISQYLKQKVVMET